MVHGERENTILFKIVFEAKYFILIFTFFSNWQYYTTRFRICDIFHTEHDCIQSIIKSIHLHPQSMIPSISYEN